MKGVKGKFLKKLKQIKPIGYLKQDRILQVNAADGYVEAFLKTPILKAQAALFGRENLEEKARVSSGDGAVGGEDPEVVDVTELMKGLEDEEEGESDRDDDNKENIGPCCVKLEKPEESDEKVRLSKSGEEISDRLKNPFAEIEVSNFRRPDLNSSTLFDPNLLAAFEQAVKEQIRLSDDARMPRTGVEFAEANPYEPPPKTRRIEEGIIVENPLSAFEKKCPPGGSDAVIFYTTSLRGIRKTFEDCSSIRFLLDSFRVLYYERDISMHMGFREEMWKTLGGKAVPPRLFIKGRYIGGTEEVLSLHERGKLRPLFEGVPLDQTQGRCDCCAGMKFILCFKCNGSHKVVADDGSSSECSECNENGLIVCPMCS